jgi:hypothetical protein
MMLDSAGLATYREAFSSELKKRRRIQIVKGALLGSLIGVVLLAGDAFPST